MLALRRRPQVILQQAVDSTATQSAYRNGQAGIKQKCRIIL